MCVSTVLTFKGVVEFNQTSSVCPPQTTMQKGQTRNPTWCHSKNKGTNQGKECMREKDEPCSEQERRVES